MPEELFKENIEIEFDKAIENINNFYKECYNNLSDDEAKKIFMIGSKPKQVGSIIVFLYDIWNFLNIYCSSSKQIELSEGIIKSFSDIKTHLQTVRDKAIRTYTLGRTNRDTSNTVSVDEGNELDNFQKSTTEKRGKLDFKIEDDDDEKTKKLKNELLKNERLICYNKDDDINKNTIKYYNQWKDKNGNIVYTNTKAENATVVNNKAFYTFEGEETDDKNKLINSSDKFIFLLDKIEKTLAENGNEKINYFDKELKKYFYEELLERYRTVNIDEDFKVNIRYGKRSKKNMDQIIPALYNRLNGKAGILNNPRIIENSRIWIQQKEDKPIECIFTDSEFFTEGNYYLFTVKIEKKNLPKYMKKYLNNSVKNDFEKMFNAYLEQDILGFLKQNIFNFCKVNFSNNFNFKKEGEDIINDEYRINDEYFKLTKKISSKNLIVQSMKENSEAVSITFVVDVGVTKTQDEIKLGDGTVYVNNLIHKLGDNIVSNPVTSLAVIRDSFYRSKQFVSVMDDRSFSLISNTKNSSNNNNEVTRYKLYYNTVGAGANHLLIDVSEYYPYNCVETINFIKICSSDDKIYTFPVEKVITEESSESDYSITINSDIPHLTNNTLFAGNILQDKNIVVDSTGIAKYKNFADNNIYSVNGNSLNSKEQLSKGYFTKTNEAIKESEDEFSVIDKTEKDKTVFTDNFSVDKKISTIEKNDKKIKKYLVLKNIDGCKSEDASKNNDVAEYVKQLKEDNKEDYVSIIGFVQSQNYNFNY